MTLFKLLNRIAITLLLLGLSVPARAQIYSWRDANGNLVLSNRRPSAALPVASYAVPKAQGLLVTRPAMAERGRAYDDLIGEHSRTHGVRPGLVRAVMQVESGFDPFARSPKGAMGLMQLMPATWATMRFRLRLGPDPDNPRDNIMAGSFFLRLLYDRFGYPGLFAAYNAGPTLYARHLAGGANLPAETRAYLAKVSIAPATVPTKPSPLFAVRHDQGQDVETASPSPTSIFALQRQSPWP